jgi:hypothetical protein
VLHRRIALSIVFAVTPSLLAMPSDVATLRARGPVVVEELVRSGASDEVLDAVCAQRDCRYSQLFWFTDLEAAKREAHRTGRPIVSLRLLGRLDEEVSCANSRFFRTMLYPDPEIATQLRDEFILHWQSVRPVPKVTIEMGDGRVIRQTITGNSAHYLLAADGHVLDVLPGMVSPALFQVQLRTWRETYASGAWQAYHEEAIATADAVRASLLLPDEDKGTKPTARAAALLAMTKSLVETPTLALLDPSATLRSLPSTRWEELGEEEKDSVVFSKPALELMARKQPLSDAMLERLRVSVAADSILNQNELHRTVHEWFVAGEVESLDALNERVYRELFLTPLDDPWMGLDPSAAFAAMGSER